MRKVILVDDSKTVIAMVGMALTDMINDSIVVFESYTNPIEFIENINDGFEDFDILIVDINMPQMSGLEVIREIKRIEHLKEKPIIVLTTDNSNETKNEAKTLGISGWILKPFNQEKLVRLLTVVLESISKRESLLIK
jgi:two-component system chemotaxis response regulator CheY